jgi:TonB-dependent starch-binding outer membrane protein SusC
MKWKSIFKKQTMLLLIVGAVVFSPGVSARAFAGQNTSGNPANAAPVKVTGKVTDVKGGAVPGVTVVVKGTTTGTVTDMEGNYSLDVPDTKASLLFSFVGYNTVQQAANQKVVNVVLAEDIKKLDDVVVIGYGSQKKADLTGSVATISPEKLNQGVTQSVAHALQGQAAGVTVIQNSGEPGGGVEIRIRGAGSINDNSPLYVVDGIVGGIGGLNPADIESMSVLKDAASAAIYGSRGANGVIIVTTKKGKRNQKALVSFNTSQGSQSVWEMPTSLDAAQRNMIHKEALKNDGTPSSESIWNYYNDPQNAVTRTDWFKEVLKPATISNSDFSISGGGEKSNYNLSLGYLNDQGIVLDTYYKRYNLRFNSQHEIAKNLTFGENFSVISSEQKGADTRGGYDGVLSSALFSMRNTPVWTDKANLIYGTPTGDFPNPVASLNVKDNRNYGTSIGGDMYLEYKLFNVLTLKSDIGYTSGYSHSKGFQSIAIGGGRGLMNHNSIGENYSNYYQYEWNNTLSFDKRISNHHIAALAGMSMEANHSEYIGAGAQDFTDESPALRYLDNATSFPSHAGGSAGDDALMSYFGRVSYEFADKYLFAANMRADGSSKFAESKRWGTFPSVSGGWRISKEDFFSGLTNTVSDLKLRASWGQLGNDKIPGYQYYSTIGSTGSPTLGGQAYTAVAQNSYSNPSIQWEVTTQKDLGIDANFLNDRLTFTADYFDKETDNILVQVPLVSSLGVSSAPYRNAGKVSNKGFDMGLTYRNRDHEFKYAVTGNVAHVDNKLVSFGIAGAKEIFAANYKNFNVGRIAEGQPIGHFYVLNALGIFKSDAEAQNYKDGAGNKIQPNAVAGDVKFEDRNHDGQISSDDRFNAGSSFPAFTYSINFSAEYKGFDVSMLWIGSSGNKIFNGLKLGGEFMQGTGYNNSTAILDRWTPTNTNASVPRVTVNDYNNNKAYSTLYLEDGGYARLKNLTFGYTFNKSLIGDKIQKLRVYLTVQNLITLTKYTGFDPEVGAYGDFSHNIFGVDTGNYPQTKSFLLGINFNF